MTKPNFQQINADIIAGLDIVAEYVELGAQMADGQPSPSGWVSCHAVGREDTNPSAAINTKTGRYKDHGGDGLSSSLWDFAAQFSDGKFADWQAARKHYAKKADIKLSGGRVPTNPADQLEWQKWNDTLVALWARHKPGVTPESVKAAGGRLARYPVKTKQFLVVALPVFGPQLIDADPAGWVIWNSTGKSLPKFNRKGQITGQVKMKTVLGSQSGLMGQYSTARLGPDQHDEKYVWIVAGPTDMMALWEIILPDQREQHLVTANSGGEIEHVQPEIAGVFAGRHVLITRDNDAAGDIGAARWCAALYPVVKEVRFVKLPDDANDLREWITK